MLVIVKLYVAVLPSAIVAGPVLSMVMLGSTSDTGSVCESSSVAVFPSSSWPVAVTVLTTVPASWADVVMKLNAKFWPGFSTIGLLPFAANAAAVRSPSTLSITLVIVTGSVEAELVLVIVKLYVAVLPSAIVAGPVLSMVMLGSTSDTGSVCESSSVAVFPSSSWPVAVTVFATVPASWADVVMKLNAKFWPGFSTIGLLPFAATPPPSALPSTLSITLVIVTGSVRGRGSCW